MWGDIMAYRMQYDDHQILHTSIKEKKQIKKPVYICIVVLILVALLLIPQVREAILPGDSAVTKLAAEEMIQNIIGGEGVVEAFAQFCSEIIHSS